MLQGQVNLKGKGQGRDNVKWGWNIITIFISLKYKIGSKLKLLPKYSLYFTKSVYDNQWVLLSQVVIDDGIQFYTTVLINVY